MLPSRPPAGLVVLALLLLGGPVRAAVPECGDPDQPCAVGLGTYHVTAPPWVPGDPPRPVVIHFHGAGQSGAAVIGDEALAAPIVGRGYVLLAPNGLTRPGRTGGSWS